MSSPIRPMLMALVAPLGLSSGMVWDTSVDANVWVKPMHSGGPAADVTTAEVELWLGDDAPVPIWQLAKAVHSRQRLAPPLSIWSALRMGSGGWSIVGLHGVS